MSRLREVKSVFLQQLLTSLRSELFGHLERKVSQYQQEMDRNQKLLDSVREGSFKFRMLGYAKQSSLTLATAASCYRCFCSSVKLWFNMKYKKVLSQNGGRSLMSVDRTCSVFMKQQKSNKQVCIYIYKIFDLKVEMLSILRYRYGNMDLYDIYVFGICTIVINLETETTISFCFVLFYW